MAEMFSVLYTPEYWMIIQEFAIMSEPIDPLSREIDNEHTCSVIHFQKSRGKVKRLNFSAISLQILLILPKFIQIDLNCAPAKNENKNIKDNSKNAVRPLTSKLMIGN